MVSQGICDAVEGFLRLAVRPSGNDPRSALGGDGVADLIGVVSLVGDEDFRRWEGIKAQQVEALVVGDFAAADLSLHRQAVSVGDQMDFRREATFRTAKILSLRPPFAPAA